MYCWASCLGDCAGGKSGEHVVSECLWEGGGINVLGGPWAPIAPKAIGLEAIKSNILCARHNSALSEVDTEGGRAFDAVRRVDREEQARRGKDPSALTPIRYVVDRGLIERWFLKTTINLVVATRAVAGWHLTGTPPREPPGQLVRAAYGLEKLPDPIGLWVAPRRGDRFLSDDRVVFTETVDEDGRLAGADYRFRGLQFAMWLSRELLPAMRVVAARPTHAAGPVENALFRSATFVWERGGRISQSLEIAG